MIINNKIWPALKSCKHQCLETGRNAANPLSELPDEILLLILSFLSTKQAAATSLLSRRWKSLWLSLPTLVFEIDRYAVKDEHFHSRQRSAFTRWANSVMEGHRGPAIDELRVVFYLDSNDCQSDIDKLVVFASAKQVKRLELNFSPLIESRSVYNYYTWSFLESNTSYLGLHRNLASLCLKYVNVTAQGIESILLSCHALEDLCIVGGSAYLTDIKLPHSSLPLKKLKVSCCPRMKSIDILAPKLVSFTYHGRPITLHIRHASLLSELSIGNGDHLGDVVTFAYYYLRSYFPQLEYLCWDLLFHERPGDNQTTGFLITNPPTMKNLKHLELCVTARCDRSLLSWARLIEASPVLEKLTLKFPELRGVQKGLYTRDIMKPEGGSIQRLKTVEHVGMLGLPLEYEFLSYVIDKSIMLKQVIHLKPSTLFHHKGVCKYAAKRVEEFKRGLPQGVTMQQRVYRNSLGKRSLFPPPAMWH